MNSLERLVLARAILEDPANWTQGSYARDEDGWPLREAHEDAICWCMTGACRLADADPMLLFKELCYGMSVPQFNDRLGTTHAEMLRIFDRAIEKLL